MFAHDWHSGRGGSQRRALRKRPAWISHENALNIENGSGNTAAGSSGYSNKIPGFMPPDKAAA